MSLITLSINNATGQFIQGINSGASSPKPNLFCPDNPTVKVYLLDPIPSATLPPLFTSTITAGNTFFMYLDDGVLNTTNIYAQLFSITTGVDSGGQFWQGIFDMSAPALEALVTAGGPAGATTGVYLQIGYVSGSGQRTSVYGQVQPIQVGIPTGAVGTPPPGQTPLSLQAASQIFYPQQGSAGLGARFISAAGKVILVYAKDNPDGSASLAITPLN